MKKLMLLPLLSTFIFYSCSDDDSCTTCKEDNGNLVTPDLSVTLSDTQSPMTGVLEAYPCQAGGAIYYGNYIEGKLTPFPGMYYLQNGEIYGDKNREISLPVGTYNMIYWGTPKYEEPIYSNPVVVDPQITIGEDLSQQYFGLRKVSADTTYYPVFDLVYTVKPAHIGTEELSAAMQRVVAGLKVIVKNKNNGILSSSIAGMEVHVGGIAEKLNMYTAAPVNQTKTVSFPLVLSADGTQMSNATVMLFPSSAKPMFKLIIKLKNGNTKVYQQPLNAPLKANNKLTLTLTLGDIFSEETSGGFTIDNWQEENETIDIPTLE